VRKPLTTSAAPTRAPFSLVGVQRLVSFEVYRGLDPHSGFVAHGELLRRGSHSRMRRASRIMVIQLLAQVGWLILPFRKEGFLTKVEVQRSGSHSIAAHVTAGTGVNS
jgi:hypothetical protein